MKIIYFFTFSLSFFCICKLSFIWFISLTLFPPLFHFYPLPTSPFFPRATSCGGCLNYTAPCEKKIQKIQVVECLKMEITLRLRRVALCFSERECSWQRSQSEREALKESHISYSPSSTSPPLLFSLSSIFHLSPFLPLATPKCSMDPAVNMRAPARGQESKYFFIHFQNDAFKNSNLIGQTTSNSSHKLKWNNFLLPPNEEMVLSIPEALPCKIPSAKCAHSFKVVIQSWLGRVTLRGHVTIWFFGKLKVSYQDPSDRRFEDPGNNESRRSKTFFSSSIAMSLKISDRRVNKAPVTPTE